MRNLKVWWAALPVGLMIYIYAPTFVWMADRWRAPDSYYAHGFLVPLVTGFWIFRKRARLSAAPKKPAPWSGFLLLAAAVLQIGASVLRVYFISAISFVVLLAGVVWFLFGTKVFKEIWFPLVFLLVMVPLPLLVIGEITLKMKFFVTEVALALIQRMGLAAVREGSYLYMPHAVILVGDPCSGLRSFLAFLCLGLVFAYGSAMPLGKKVVMVACGLPLAIAANVGRVFSMALLAEVYGMKFVGGWVHDAAGIATFVFALAVFLFLRKNLEGSGVHAAQRLH